MTTAKTMLIALAAMGGLACQGADGPEVATEEFPLATASSWFGDGEGEIVSEVRTDGDVVVATAIWDVANASGTVELTEKSVGIDTTGMELSLASANQLTYQQWSPDAAYAGCFRWVVERTRGCIRYTTCCQVRCRPGFTDCYECHDTYDCY